jgi:hypothetical protein
MEVSEASSNFDLDTLDDFLLRLKSIIDSGFSDREMARILKAAEETKLDGESRLEFLVKFQGKQITLHINIYKDDINSSDISFFTDDSLAKEIDNQIRLFFSN